MNVTIGGERLGSGKKMKAEFENYQRSTHDLSYTWRSTMAAGTLVPFMVQVALPGDTFDIDLNCSVLTHPTIGPLFGSYKVQLDIFQIPIRLYVAELHMNKLGIGKDMSLVTLPQLHLTAPAIVGNKPIDNQQINGSAIFSYLGIRGLGTLNSAPANPVDRYFNAVPYIAYWDIYKNYYANKQEEIGVVIHKTFPAGNPTLTACTLAPYSGGASQSLSVAEENFGDPFTIMENTVCTITGTTNFDAQLNPSLFKFNIRGDIYPTVTITMPATELFNNWQFVPGTGWVGTAPTIYALNHVSEWGLLLYYPSNSPQPADDQPQLTTFDLNHIDDMRTNLLRYVPEAQHHFVIHSGSDTPYSLPMTADAAGKRSFMFSQEGLALKTYQSDLFNNWISTEWIDGTDGISDITKIDTTGNSFTLDELNLSQKVYDMLNRIAISGGSYDDWLDAVYTHERTRSAENPIYLGGLIKQLIFQEVVATTDSEANPLGSLAGRGVLGSKHKGGKIIAKIDEPSYIMGIVSLTPNVDYSQGNAWDVNLRTMNDFHKPALDQIGFQDLVTDQFAWWDTNVGDYTHASVPPAVTYKSAGKQPAWVNYMTNVNKCYGNFADQTQQMWMTLNRRYELDFTGSRAALKDLTTYIDPIKYNHIFADTRRDAMNFWVQIANNITARRKMSAKIMPNL